MAPRTGPMRVDPRADGARACLHALPRAEGECIRRAPGPTQRARSAPAGPSSPTSGTRPTSRPASSHATTGRAHTGGWGSGRRRPSAASGAWPGPAAGCARRAHPRVRPRGCIGPGLGGEWGTHIRQRRIATARGGTWATAARRAARRRSTAQGESRSMGAPAVGCAHSIVSDTRDTPVASGDGLSCGTTLARLGAIPSPIRDPRTINNRPHSAYTGGVHAAATLRAVDAEQERG